jgi:hypothetical protein
VLGALIAGIAVLLNWVGNDLLKWEWLGYGFWNAWISATLGLAIIVALIMNGLKKAMAGGMPGGYTPM